MKKIVLAIIMAIGMVMAASADILKTGEGRYLSSDFDGIVFCFEGDGLNSFVQGLPTLVKEYQDITFTIGERHVAWADIQELFDMGYTAILAAKMEYDGEEYSEFLFLLDDGNHYAAWIIPYDAFWD